MENEQLNVKDETSDYVLMGYVGKPADTGIIYCPCIPRVITEEEHKKLVANTMDARVSKNHANPHYANKLGHVIKYNPDQDLYCLHIEVKSEYDPHRRNWWGRVHRSEDYDDVWFRKNELEVIYHYDDKGDDHPEYIAEYAKEAAAKWEREHPKTDEKKDDEPFRIVVGARTKYGVLNSDGIYDLENYNKHLKEKDEKWMEAIDVNKLRGNENA